MTNNLTVFCQVGIHDAWQTLQLEPAPPDVLMGLKALHISAQLAQQASAAAQGVPTISHVFSVGPVNPAHAAVMPTRVHQLSAWAKVTT